MRRRRDVRAPHKRVRTHDFVIVGTKIASVSVVPPAPTAAPAAADEIRRVQELHLLGKVALLLQVLLQGRPAAATVAAHAVVGADQLVVLAVPTPVDRLVEPVGGRQRAKELLGQRSIASLQWGGVGETGRHGRA